MIVGDQALPELSLRRREKARLSKNGEDDINTETRKMAMCVLNYGIRIGQRAAEFMFWSGLSSLTGIDT